MSFNLIDILLEEQTGEKNKLLLEKKNPPGKQLISWYFALITSPGFD